MKNLYKIVLSFAAIVAFAGAISVTKVSAQGKIGEIKRRMDAHNKGLTTLRTEVTMVKFNAQIQDDDTTVGTAIYAKGKGKNPYVRIDWRRPEESLAVIEGSYYMYRPKLAIVYTGSVNSVRSSKDKTKGSSAFAFMSMSKAELDANYDIALLGENATLSNGVKAFHLQLTPKVNTSYKTAELWVDVDGMPVQSKIIEKNNDTTTVLLSKLEKNVSLKTSDFKINWPNGTKVEKS